MPYVTVGKESSKDIEIYYKDWGVSPMMSSKLVKNATLKAYPGAAHGMCTTHKDQVNADLLAFIKS